MTDRLRIIQLNPIGNQLDSFRDLYLTKCQDKAVSPISPIDVFEQLNRQGKHSIGSSPRAHPSWSMQLLLTLAMSSTERQLLLTTLITVLLLINTSNQLPSLHGGRNLRDDLAHCLQTLTGDDCDIPRMLPLLQAVMDQESDQAIWDQVSVAVNPSTPPPSAAPTGWSQQTPSRRNTGGLSNSSELRKDVDAVLKAELGTPYLGIPNFDQVFLGRVAGLDEAVTHVWNRCTQAEDPLYRSDAGWKDWPPNAQERDVLAWFAGVTDTLADWMEEDHRHQELQQQQQPPHPAAAPVRRRPLAQPHRPVAGSTAERKLDICFVDNPDATVHSKLRWTEILIPGELKSNRAADTQYPTWLDLGRYAREVFGAQDSRRFVLGFTLCGPLMRLWVFDRVGATASTAFNINHDGRRFVHATLAFLRMDPEQLGFDPTIITDGDRRYMDIDRNGRRERLVLDEVVNRVPCVVGRATTCWKAHRERTHDDDDDDDDDDAEKNDDDWRGPLVIKDSWQFPEREEEGQLLREATRHGVINVARYYHHETVRVRGHADDIGRNVRRDLDLTNATNYRRAEQSMTLPSIGRAGAGRKRSASDRDPDPSSESVTKRIRSRSSTGKDAPPLSSRKRTRSTPGSHGRSKLAPPPDSSCQRTPRANMTAGRSIVNRIHRRVIVRDHGTPIYKASSPARLLAALEGCIAGCESLYVKAGVLQRDISPANLMMNDDPGNNPSWPAFLIDLDLAISKDREAASGARGKTGTLAFMAIGVLRESEPHSFMHDLESFFWVLFWIGIHYQGPGRGAHVTLYERWNYLDLVDLGHLKCGLIGDEQGFDKTVKRDFTLHYQPLVPCINALRKAVFPDDKPWKKPDVNLFRKMQHTLRDARNDLLSGQSNPASAAPNNNTDDSGFEGSIATTPATSTAAATSDWSVNESSDTQSPSPFPSLPRMYSTSHSSAPMEK